MIHFCKSEPEIFIFVSQQVALNVIDPIFDKKTQISNIICKNSYQIKIANTYFLVFTHKCANFNPFIHWVGVLQVAPHYLNVFKKETGSKKYFGVKNKILTTFTGSQHFQQIIDDYLM